MSTPRGTWLAGNGTAINLTELSRQPSRRNIEEGVAALSSSGARTEGPKNHRNSTKKVHESAIRSRNTAHNCDGAMTIGDGDACYFK